MNGHIACGHPETARVAREILDKDGNAFDAMVAATFTAAFVEPCLTSLGGGGFFVVSKDGKEKVIDAMPTIQDKKLGEPEKMTVDFGSATQNFWIGPNSVANPGIIPGLIHLHKNYGTMPWKDLVKPTIDLARNGVIVIEMQAYILDVLKTIYTYSPEARELFMPNGKYLVEGDLMKNEKLADFLEKLSENPDPGILKKDYEKLGIPYEQVMIKERDPVRLNYKDYEVITNSPPSPGGLLTCHTLQQFEKKEYSNEVERYAALCEAMIQTDKVRKSNVDSHWNVIDLISSVLGTTTQISIVDKFGNAASSTTSNGEGCGIVLESGIMPNNFLGEADLCIEQCRKLGIKTIPSMMSPSILKKDGKVFAAIGSGGSERIRSAVLQVVDLVISGMDLKEAVEKPRMHWDGTTLQIEKPDSIKEELEKLTKVPVNSWPKKNLYFGGAHIATVNGAAGDSRRDGSTA